MFKCEGVVIIIVPKGTDLKNDTEEQLIIAFRKAGYSPAASRWLAGKVKGTIKDDNPIL